MIYFRAYWCFLATGSEDLSLIFVIIFKKNSTNIYYQGQSGYTNVQTDGLLTIA